MPVIKHMESQPHIVIVGGGFAGLYAAKTLARGEVRVTLIDRNNYHLFQPLLYQVATAGLSPGEIAQPIRSLFNRHRKVETVMAEVTAVDLAARTVTYDERSVGYDYLIVAAGASSTYFGHDEWVSVAPSLKTIEDALDIRRRILCSYEWAELAPDAAARRRLLTFVVIGGGATGVEMAGTIAEMARYTLKNDFRHCDPTATRVLLIQSGDRVLPDYPEKLSRSAANQLQALGVEVRTGARVTNITADTVYVGEEAIPCGTALWTAGVTASPLGKALGVEVDRGGRVTVNPDLTVPGYPQVYVVGDLSNFPHQNNTALPGTAPVAIQMGVAAAHNITRTMAGQETLPFHYNDRGTLATIGRAAAVGVIKGRHLSGFVAWVAWLVIHLYYLVGFENRITVFFSWAWSYFTSQRGARLITRHGDKNG